MFSRIINNQRLSLLKYSRRNSSFLINGPGLGRKISLSFVNNENKIDIKVLLEAVWSNKSEIIVNGLNEKDIEIERNPEEKPENQDIFVEFNVESLKESAFIHVKVPEMIDIELESELLNVETKNKIMGDIIIIGDEGKVSIDKCKGTNLMLDIGNANLQINRVLEGNSIIRAGKIKGKMVNGDSLSIVSNDSIHLDAVYGANTTMIAKEKVLLDTFRGNLNVRSYHGDINIHGIDGDIQAISDQGNCDILINYLKLDTTKPIIAAPLGSIKCHISPELRAAITMESKEIIYDELQCTHNENEIVHKSVDQSGITTILHTFAGLSEAAKVPNWKSTGKINLSAAEDSFHLQLQDRAYQALKEKAQPLLALNAKNSITFGTLSWKDSVRQRFFRKLNEKEN